VKQFGEKKIYKYILLKENKIKMWILKLAYICLIDIRIYRAVYTSNRKPEDNRTL
jgi:hypothetical protein